MFEGIKNFLLLRHEAGVEEVRKRGYMRGQLGNLPGMFMVIGVALLVAAFVALILGNVGDTMTPGSAEANITADGVDVITSMVALAKPLGIVGIAGIIIGYLMGFFSGGRR